MSYEAQSDHMQQFELLMTTMFTCRSIVKYNLTVGEEQKKELLADIDTSLEVLRSYLLTDPSKPALLPSLPTDSSPALCPVEDAILYPVEDATLCPVEDTIVPSEHASDDNEQQMLQALYKMYHAYMNANKNNNINTFISRFNDAMLTIQEIQRVVEHSYPAKGIYTRDSTLEEPLHRVKAFIADIYYIFMEFMRVLSETLQQNNVQLDTEKLSSLQGEQAIDEKLPSQSNLASLFGVYEAHQRLNQKRGVVAARIADAVAFLEFLKEGFGSDVNQRDEILSQLNNVIRLLHDVSRLVADYEKAAATLFCLR